MPVILRVHPQWTRQMQVGSVEIAFFDGSRSLPLRASDAIPPTIYVYLPWCSLSTTAGCVISNALYGASFVYHTDSSSLKLRTHQQQCRSNIRLCGRNILTLLPKNGNNVEAAYDFVERIAWLVAFENVASTLLLAWTGLKVHSHRRLAVCNSRHV